MEGKDRRYRAKIDKPNGIACIYIEIGKVCSLADRFPLIFYYPPCSIISASSGYKFAAKVPFIFHLRNNLARNSFQFVSFNLYRRRPGGSVFSSDQPEPSERISRELLVIICIFRVADECERNRAAVSRFLVLSRFPLRPAHRPAIPLLLLRSSLTFLSSDASIEILLACSFE